MKEGIYKRQVDGVTSFFKVLRSGERSWYYRSFEGAQRERLSVGDRDVYKSISHEDMAFGVRVSDVDGSNRHLEDGVYSITETIPESSPRRIKSRYFAIRNDLTSVYCDSVEAAISSPCVASIWPGDMLAIKVKDLPQEPYIITKPISCKSVYDAGAYDEFPADFDEFVIIFVGKHNKDFDESIRLDLIMAESRPCWLKWLGNNGFLAEKGPEKPKETVAHIELEVINITGDEVTFKIASQTKLGFSEFDTTNGILIDSICRPEFYKGRSWDTFFTRGSERDHYDDEITVSVEDYLRILTAVKEFNECGGRK